MPGLTGGSIPPDFPTPPGICPSVLHIVDTLLYLICRSAQTIQLELDDTVSNDQLLLGITILKYWFLRAVKLSIASSVF